MQTRETWPSGQGRWSHQAWQLFVERLEERIERENAPALRRKGPEERTLWTEFGPVKTMRQRYYYADGRIALRSCIR